MNFYLDYLMQDDSDQNQQNQQQNVRQVCSQNMQHESIIKIPQRSLLTTEKKEQKRNYGGDRMIPYRGIQNLTQLNYETSNAKPCNQFDSAHQALLYETQHNLSEMYSKNSSADQLTLFGMSPLQKLQSHEEMIEQSLKGCELNSQPILQFSASNKQALPFSSNIKVLENIMEQMRYKETRRLMIVEEMENSESNKCPYDKTSYIDANGIISPLSYHIIQWSQHNEILAVGVGDTLVVMLIGGEFSCGRKKVCESQFKITAIRWLEPIERLENPRDCCVIAVATTDPSQRIQIWEAKCLRKIRTINVSASIVITSLAWKEHLLIAATKQGQLMTFDVRVSLAQRREFYTYNKILHCAFSNDKKYISICGGHVKIYSFDIKQLEPVFTEHMSPDDDQGGVSLVVWSHYLGNIFAFSLVTTQQCPNEDSDQTFDLQMKKYEIRLFNADTKQLATTLQMQAEVQHLLFSKVKDDTFYGQTLLAGLRNGKVALIKVIGKFNIQTQITHYLVVSKYDGIYYMDEAPDCSQLAIFTFDQVLQIWNYTKEKHEINQNSSLPIIGNGLLR